MTTPDAFELSDRVAAYGHPGATPMPEVARDLGDAAGDLVRRCETERVTGHLLAAVNDGIVDEACGEAAERAHERAMTLAVTLEARLLRHHRRLRALGIDVRVLKGPAVAHTVYRDPSLRSFGDIDLLVRGSSYDETVAALTEAGAHRRFPEPRPGFDRRFGKGVSLVDPDGLQIDLHRTLAPGPFGLSLHTDDLFTPASAFTLAGTVLLGLGPTTRFLHACAHAALGDRTPRLVAQRDVAEMVVRTDLDPGAVLDLARSWRCRAVVAQAMVATWSRLRLLDEPPLLRWALEYEPDRFEQRALVASTTGSYGRQAAAGLFALHGRDRLAYAAALLLPSPDYLRGRDRSYRDRARRALALARRPRSAR